MAEYLVETYLPAGPSAAAVQTGRAQAAAEQFAGEGTPVRYLRSIVVPEDETCFYLHEADAVETVREVARRVGLRFARIAEANTEEAVRQRRKNSA